MKIVPLALALLLLAASPDESSRNYFTNVRDVTSSAPGKQNFLLIDPEIWKHANRGLGDLRLYAGAREVPYYLTTDVGQARVTDFRTHLLELGTTGGFTTFFVDTSGVDEYNRLTLQLATRNFVGKATVEGIDVMGAGSTPTKLGEYTLYDFTKEQLGSNFTLKLPDSRFHYLRITLSSEIPSTDVQGATLAQWAAEKTGYTLIPADIEVAQQGKETIIRWKSDAAVPLERVTLGMPNINFCRQVRIENAEGVTVASGGISRIRMTKYGQPVESENLEIPVYGTHSSAYKVVISNGDDPPLKLYAVQPWFVSRKLYFDPLGDSSFKLYYGDAKRGAPIYDYAKLFQLDRAPAEAAMGPGMHNPAYTPHPDERPWSEQHPALLWAAMLIAIAALGAVTLRGLVGKTRQV